MHLLRPGEKPPSREAVIAKLKYAHSHNRNTHTHAHNHHTATFGNVLAGERFFYRLHLLACLRVLRRCGAWGESSLILCYCCFWLAGG